LVVPPPHGASSSGCSGMYACSWPCG
jgi:hypothetical protein